MPGGNVIQAKRIGDLLRSHGCEKENYQYARLCSCRCSVFCLQSSHSLALPSRASTRRLCQIWRALTSCDILLVGKHQQQRILHFAILNDTRQLVLRLGDPIAVVAVDNEDETLGAREVVAPQRSDLVLPTDVPDVELGVLVGHGFDVEADGRDGRHIGVKLELVQDSYEAVRRTVRGDT